jgi:phenylacetic acid degradation operon negative regulatory protein
MTVVVDATVPIPTRILVLGMAHEDGTILGSELYPVAEACGQSAEQVRSCLRRLVAEALFTREGEGRDARFHATQAGMAELGSTMERTRLAYLQDAAGRGWDRKWRLVGFAVPESKRPARDAFRDRLLALGGAPIHNGLYASPHPWLKDVVADADRLDVRGHVTTAVTDELEVGGVTDPREIARLLWPIEDVAARYEDFLAAFELVPQVLEDMRRDHQRLSDERFLPGALAMGVAFQRCFNADPLLPPELLPRPWPGRAARELLIRSRRHALKLREQHDRPALFGLFDETVEQLP